MKAAIFDFDGVILDTETAKYECWRDTYLEFGHELTLEMWSSNVGGDGYDGFHPFETLERLHGKPHDWDKVHEARRARYQACVASMGCMDGVEEVLDAAREAGLKLAVASSSNERWIHGNLRRLGLFDRFDTVCTGDEAGAIKPNPAVYHLTLERLGVDASEAFTFEDSTKGVDAAKAAGIYCVAVVNTVTAVLNLENANRRLESLSAVPFDQLLSEIRGEYARAL